MLREIVHFVRVGSKVMKLQKQHTRAEFLDLITAQADAQGYAEVRSEMAHGLTGRVLEIGCGTGSMFAYYGDSVEVEAIEPEDDFRALAEDKAKGLGERFRVTAGAGEVLGYPDESFDAAILCLVLCSVKSVETVLTETFRVLRPGGHLRALEHVRSERKVPGALMDVANPLWLGLNKQGCHWNRDPLDAMRAAGFAVDQVKAFQRFDTVLPAFPMKQVWAHKPGA